MTSNMNLGNVQSEPDVRKKDDYYAKVSKLMKEGALQQITISGEIYGDAPVKINDKGLTLSKPMYQCKVIIPGVSVIIGTDSGSWIAAREKASKFLLDFHEKTSKLLKNT